MTRSRLVRWCAGLVLLVAALSVLGWFASRPERPDAFYGTAPAGAPGTVLRVEPFTRDVPTGARASRVLYVTTGSDGAPAVASAIVLVPSGAGPHPAVLWTHGTTGIVPGCAPSLLEHPFANVPALAAALARNWVVIAPDYTGLGTPGPHGYLVGDAEARPSLDAMRAATQLPGLSLRPGVVVWGHSQGGHAALWTARLGPEYAPELRIAGVAAMAPATDLPRMLARIQGTPVGGIMSAYVLHAYAAAYPDVRIDEYVPRSKRFLVADIAGRCLDGPRALPSVVASLAIGGAPFATDPVTGAFGRRLAQNVPDGRIDAPVLIAQGLADPLVAPDLQAAYVERRCAAGQAIEYRRYRDADHLSLVAPGSPLEADLLEWTAARFAGRTPAPSCELSAAPR